MGLLKGASELLAMTAEGCFSCRKHGANDETGHHQMQRTGPTCPRL
jgi:hypothetical protein